MENTKQIKVLLVNAVNPSRDIESLYPPLGVAYLVSYFKKYIGTDAVNFRLTSLLPEKSIVDFQPDIVGITCVSQNYNLAKKISKFAKENNVPYVLIGGCHISMIPKTLDKNMNIGVIGEGEETFLDLINVYIAKRKFETKDLESINGLVFWEKGNLKFTAKRQLITPLDRIPNPDRTLFNVDPNKIYMFTSRGCPYRCVFCASSRFWNKVRFFSAQYVIDEIKELVDLYGAKRIDFYDDLFIADKKRLKELVFLIEKEALNKKVEFHVNCRANLVNDEICSFLKRMNVKGVSLGLESGSPEILKYLKGCSVTVEDNFKAIETVKKHGLYCVGSFVIGSPMDTKETIFDTLQFIKKSKLDEFAVYTLTPFPGTPIWEIVEKEKLVSSDYNEIDWSCLDVEYSYSYEYNIHLAKNLTRTELHEIYLLFEKEQKWRLVRRAFVLMFTEPSRFLYHLRKRLKTIFSKKIKPRKQLGNSLKNYEMF